VEKDIAGNYLSKKECLTCPSNSYRDPSNYYFCKPCPDSLMTWNGAKCTCANGYSEWNNECLENSVYNPIISQYPIETVASIEYTQIYEKNRKRDTPSTEKVRSDYLYKNTYTAAVNCRVSSFLIICVTLTELNSNMEHQNIVTY
jgi:hypothetical protein